MKKVGNPVVQTKSGKIAGTCEDGLYVFKGVRYAEPPTGDLRWLPPQPLKPWTGVPKAQNFGTIAPQPDSQMAFILDFETLEPQSEDCLFLNIWTPGLDDSRRPVMVWIHGGAFSMGSGSMEAYRKGVLSARGDLVLVTLNYRLGLLGFLNLNEVTGGKIPSTGNEGLLDQISALEWVRDNIQAFGGDPANVTVFGESAGGMSIGCLLTMPKARGLFHKAVLESFVGNMANPLASGVKAAKEFLRIVSLEARDVKGLRALTVPQILGAQQELALRTPGGMAPVIPTVDGKVLPAMPIDSIKSGSSAKIPLLVGTNLDEEKLFAAMIPPGLTPDEAAMTARAERLYGAKNAKTLIETYRKARAKRGESTTPADILSAIQTDVMFRLKAISVLEAWCKHKQSAFSYLFAWKSPAMGGTLGACHALEIGFIFGTYSGNFCGTGPQADRLAHNMQDAWIAFALTGSPGCESLGFWPQYCDSRKTMILGAESHVEVAPYEEERHVWDLISINNKQ